MAAPRPAPARLHRPRPPARAARPRKTRAWSRLFGRFDRVVTHSERGRRRSRRSASRDAKLRVIPHPAFHSDPVRARRRAHRPRARRDQALQGPPGRGRGRARRPERAAARRRRPADPARRPPRRRRRPRRVAARLSRRARDGATPSAQQPSPSSPTAPSSTSRAPSCRRSAPACRRSSTTSAGSARSWARSEPAASCRRATSTALGRALRELLDDADALAEARAGAAAGTRGADLGQGGRRPRRALRGARVRFRPPRPLRRSRRTPARPLRRRRRGLAARGGRGRGGLECRDGRGRRGGLRRLPARRRRDRRPAARHPRVVRPNSLDEDAAAEYAAEFTRAATRRFRRYATLLADLDEP